MKSFTLIKHFPIIILNKILGKVYSFPIPVALMYHSISKASFSIAISPDEFVKQMNLLNKKKRIIISPENLFSKKIQDRDILLTFDDGYLDNYEVVYPLLKKYSYKVVVFIISLCLCFIS